MSTSETKTAIAQALAPLFPGFRYVQEEGFEREIPGGSQKISLPVSDYGAFSKFSLVFCVRLNAVEQILDRFSGSPPEYQSMTVTSMTPLAYFFPDKSGTKQYRIETPSDLRNVVAELATRKDEFLRFLDTHRDVRALDAAMNSPGGAAFDNSNQPYRAMHAVILARLAKNERFDEIVKQYRTEAQEWHKESRDQYERLVEYLEQL
ncbi:MAG TPA: hypothetical protein VG675_07720 [Bryobacteraceae bacterium]|nr:hypothetical protein [Bryobacteraceae bacterium]